VTRFAREGALAVAIVAAAGLGLQTWVTAQTRGSLFAAVADVSQYFTILTNVLVLVVAFAAAIGRPASPRSTGGVVVSIMVVGIIFHWLLAGLRTLHGLAFVAVLLLHTVSPILTLLWWLGFGDHKALRWRDALVWLVWPLAYCVYALLRAQSSGYYPYFFIDLPKLGWAGLARSTALVGAGYYVCGLALVAIGRVLPGRVRTSPPRPSGR
jgi:hypothetical protein